MNLSINFSLSFVLLSSVLVFLLSCAKTKTLVDKSNETEIKSWNIGDKSANISESDITMDLVYGTDITALKADVKLSDGASISPDPTNSIDYTNPVTFTVTAEDKITTKDYTVKVSVAKNDKAEILSWDIGGKAANISRANVTITLSYGTDITALKADVKLSPGATISPDPANSVDYTYPLKFIVTAEDGKTTKDYKVKVSVAKSNEVGIKSWKCSGKMATIRGTDITITLSYGTDITALKADIELSAGATVSPDPANSIDYTNPVNFTVTAADGKTTKDYMVTVNTSNTEAEIKSWKVGDKYANISGTDITITLVYGTDITALTADVGLSAGANINPDPAQSIDYTNPVTFTVTAEYGNTTKDYKVKVNLAKNDKAEVKSWKFGNKVATISGTDITITLSSVTDITALTANVQLSKGATINPDPTQSKDYTNTVTFTVTSEDGSKTNNYKVTISVDPIISWTAGWRDDDAYTATINQGTGKIDIDVNSADFDTKISLSAGVTISPDPNKVTDWTDEVAFTTTKGSKTKTYKVKVKVNGKNIIKVTDANVKNTIEDEIAKNGNTANYNYIDVSSVTDMQELFKNKTNFNGDISKWDVSGVNNMYYMFSNATAFNKDIGAWNVSKVTNMSYMFFNAITFNKNIGNWVVSSVTDMSGMFREAEAFNQNIGGWGVSNVTDMRNMFNTASSFNQNIGGWDVSNVKNMRAMFLSALVFNQDIGDWKVSKVANMNYMFWNARAFNKDIGDWKVSNVTDMSRMFLNAITFNQDIGSWKVSNVKNMEYMFFNAIAFNQDIGSWKVSNVENMNSMFFRAKKFNKNISSWDVGKVTSCRNFSQSATNFQPANKPTFKVCRE